MRRAARSLITKLDTLSDDVEVDVVVLGAGAAGLATALFSCLEGLDVLVLESSGRLGGTSALTAGTLWLPGLHATDGRNAKADADRAAEYLDAALGPDRDGLRRAFLEEGRQIIERLERDTRVRFNRRSHHPDYLGDLDGASAAGRAIEAADFDGRALGRDLALIRSPLKDFTILGGLAPNREELASYTVIARNPLTPLAWRNAFAAIPRVARHAVDLLRFGRSSQLTFGNALIGALLASLCDWQRAQIVLHCQAIGFECGGAGIEAVVAEDQTGRRRIRVRGGVVSATGGFNQGPRRTEILPDVPANWSAVVKKPQGYGQELASSLGAVFERQESDAFWAPVSLVPTRDGEEPRIYPHFALDRGKPGFIIVDGEGRRFTSEAAPYHVLGEALRRQGQPAFLIAGRRADKRFGIGVVKPGGWGLRQRIRDGYVVSALTLAALADRLGIAPGVLAHEVQRFNEWAVAGRDDDFGRGDTPYQRNLGDPDNTPNPSLGAVDDLGPYYAIRLYPSDIGAASGLVTNSAGQLLDSSGGILPGAYAVGNDARSIMGGRYPGPGITLGPAVVFASRVAQDIASRTAACSRTKPVERIRIDSTN